MQQHQSSMAPQKEPTTSSAEAVPSGLLFKKGHATEAAQYNKTPAPASPSADSGQDPPAARTSPRTKLNVLLQAGGSSGGRTGVPMKRSPRAYIRTMSGGESERAGSSEVPSPSHSPRTLSRFLSHKQQTKAPSRITTRAHSFRGTSHTPAPASPHATEASPPNTAAANNSTNNTAHPGLIFARSPRPASPHRSTGTAPQKHTPQTSNQHTAHPHAAQPHAPVSSFLIEPWLAAGVVQIARSALGRPGGTSADGAGSSLLVGRGRGSRASGSGRRSSSASSATSLSPQPSHTNAYTHPHGGGGYAAGSAAPARWRARARVGSRSISGSGSAAAHRRRSGGALGAALALDAASRSASLPEGAGVGVRGSSRGAGSSASRASSGGGVDVDERGSARSARERAQLMGESGLSVILRKQPLRPPRSPTQRKSADHLRASTQSVPPPSASLSPSQSTATPPILRKPQQQQQQPQQQQRPHSPGQPSPTGSVPLMATTFSVSQPSASASSGPQQHSTQSHTGGGEAHTPSHTGGDQTDNHDGSVTSKPEQQPTSGQGHAPAVNASPSTPTSAAAAAAAAEQLGTAKSFYVPSAAKPQQQQGDQPVSQQQQQQQQQQQHTGTTTTATAAPASSRANAAHAHTGTGSTAGSVSSARTHTTVPELLSSPSPRPLQRRLAPGEWGPPPPHASITPRNRPPHESWRDLAPPHAGGGIPASVSASTPSAPFSAAAAQGAGTEEGPPMRMRSSLGKVPRASSSANTVQHRISEALSLPSASGMLKGYAPYDLDVSHNGQPEDTTETGTEDEDPPPAFNPLYGLPPPLFKAMSIRPKAMRKLGETGGGAVPSIVAQRTPPAAKAAPHAFRGSAIFDEGYARGGSQNQNAGRPKQIRKPPAPAHHSTDPSAAPNETPPRDTNTANVRSSFEDAQHQHLYHQLPPSAGYAARLARRNELKDASARKKRRSGPHYTLATAASVGKKAPASEPSTKGYPVTEVPTRQKRGSPASRRGSLSQPTPAGEAAAAAGMPNTVDMNHSTHTAHAHTHATVGPLHPPSALHNLVSSGSLELWHGLRLPEVPQQDTGASSGHRDATRRANTVVGGQPEGATPPDQRGLNRRAHTLEHLGAGDGVTDQTAQAVAKQLLRGRPQRTRTVSSLVQEILQERNLQNAARGITPEVLAQLGLSPSDTHSTHQATTGAMSALTAAAQRQRDESPGAQKSFTTSDTSVPPKSPRDAMTGRSYDSLGGVLHTLRLQQGAAPGHQVPRLDLTRAQSLSQQMMALRSLREETAAQRAAATLADPSTPATPDWRSSSAGQVNPYTRSFSLPVRQTTFATHAQSAAPSSTPPPKAGTETPTAQNAVLRNLGRSASHSRNPSHGSELKHAQIERAGSERSSASCPQGGGGGGGGPANPLHSLPPLPHKGPDAPGSYTSKLLASKALQGQQQQRHASPRGATRPTHRRVCSLPTATESSVLQLQEERSSSGLLSADTDPGRSRRKQGNSWAGVIEEGSWGAQPSESSRDDPQTQDLASLQPEDSHTQPEGGSNHSRASAGAHSSLSRVERGTARVRGVSAGGTMSPPEEAATAEGSVHDDAGHEEGHGRDVDVDGMQPRLADTQEGEQLLQQVPSDYTVETALKDLQTNVHGRVKGGLLQKHEEAEHEKQRQQAKREEEERADREADCCSCFGPPKPAKRRQTNTSQVSVTPAEQQRGTLDFVADPTKVALEERVGPRTQAEHAIDKFTYKLPWDKDAVLTLECGTQGGASTKKLELTTASGADYARAVLGLNAALLHRQEPQGKAVPPTKLVQDLPWHNA